MYFNVDYEMDVILRYFFLKDELEMVGLMPDCLATRDVLLSV